MEVKKIILRSEQDANDTWDLTSIFKNTEGWQSTYDETEKIIHNLKPFKGKLKEKDEILSALNLFFQLQQKVEKLYTYAHLLVDQDSTNSDNKVLLEKALSLYSSFSSESSFIAPELLKLSERTLENLAIMPELAEYKIYLTELLREKGHTLTEEEELIVAKVSEALSCSREIFSQLTNADFEFEDVEKEGQKLPLSHATLINFLTDKDRAVRKDAYQKYLQTFEKHRYSLASIYLSNLKKDAFYTKVRRFKSTRERSLFSDNINESVYEQLLSSVNDGLGVLHEYYDLRKNLLNLDRTYVYDTYVPMIEEVPLKFGYDEAVEILSEALLPLGEEYVSTLIKGLTTDRWVDRYENKGKRSGAYSSGCYGSKPYILMNFQTEGIDSLFTLAHEAGHSMHSYLSQKHQNYSTHGYTIFVAEVASTLNEMLLNRFLITKYSDNKNIRTYLINHVLDSIKSTFFRQTMFAEFEKLSHELGDNNRPITLDTLRSIHNELQKKYFGNSVVIQDIDSIECLRIPHFYSSFYVYKYATGIAAALSLSEDILSNKSNSLKKYLTFLSSGSSKYSLDLLRDAGVDLDSKEPVIKTISYFKENLDELKLLTA